MSIAVLYDARGLLAVPDGHPLAPLRFRRHCRVRDLQMMTQRGICSWCGAGGLPGPRNRYHGPCKADLRWSSFFLRRQVESRDAGVCFFCGATTSALPGPSRWRHYWEAHHIVSVKEGGGCCGLANLATACLGCHTHLSAESLRLAAFERKLEIAAAAQPGQVLLPWDEP